MRFLFPILALFGLRRLQFDEYETVRKPDSISGVFCYIRTGKRKTRYLWAWSRSWQVHKQTQHTLNFTT